MDKINYNKEDLIGHDAVAAVIKNEKGEMLVQEHVKYGFWTIPVGKVKTGQTLEEGLKEEIRDECNIEIVRCREIATKKYKYERNGTDVDVRSHLFEVPEYSGSMKNNEPNKHKQQIFLPLDKIKELPYLSDMTLLYLETVGVKRAERIARSKTY